MNQNQPNFVQPQQPYHQQTPPQPFEAPKKAKTPTLAVVVISGVVAFGLGIAAGNSSQIDPEALPAATSTITETIPGKDGEVVTQIQTQVQTVSVTVTAPAPTQKQEQKKEAPKNEIGAGVHKIGTDIPAGRYVTTVPDGSWGCYFARLKDDSGDFSAIIANANFVGDGAKGSVTIKETDAFIEFSGDCVWTKA